MKKKDKEKLQEIRQPVSEVCNKVWKPAATTGVPGSVPPKSQSKDLTSWKGESGNPNLKLMGLDKLKGKESNESNQVSEVESDSSDVDSSDSEEGEISSTEEADQFIEVKSKRNQRRDRGKGPKSN